MKFKISTILLFTYFLIFSSEAQEIEQSIQEKYRSFKYNNSKEMSYLKVDKKIYFGGGIVSFNLVVFDQYLRPTQLSKIAHLTLVHESSDIRQEYVLRMENGIVNGEIKIPIELPTGNYQLIASTEFMRNGNMELSEHRLPIYIQNTSEAPKKVASTIRYDRNTDYLIDYIDKLNSKYKIDLRQGESKISIAVSADEKSLEDFFLVSEGFSELQFIAKIKLKKNGSLISIPKSQFKGNFQRLVLLDAEQNLLTVKNFYLPSGNQLNISDEVFHQNQLEVRIEKNLISSIELSEDFFGRDSIDLFRRMYRIYYDIPVSERVDHLSFDELISSSYLSKLSSHSFSRWSAIVSSTELNSEVTYLQESNLRLRGKLEGDLSLLDQGILSVHFFENDVDINIPIRADGLFSMDVIIPVGNDAFYTSLLDKYGNDISDKFVINFNLPYEAEYYDQVDYHDSNVTDSLISLGNEFNYVLSTFNQFPNSKIFFWENEKMDRKIKVADYRDLFSVEEFIREVVTGVNVRSRDGHRFLKMVSPDKEGFFDKSPLLVINNSIVENSDVLFDLPLEKIVSFNLVFMFESLNRFGAPFKNGILVVETNDSKMEIDDKYLDKGARQFVSYQRRINKNSVLTGFSSTKILNTNSDQYFVKELERIVENRKFNFNLQFVNQDGFYYFKSKEILVQE